MKIHQLVDEAKKGVRSVKHTVKPRDPNWGTMQAKRTSGAAGSHGDKKKAMKQGDVKHKGQEFAESSRNPDLMSLSDYDSHQHSQMDADKRNFKRDEMENELGHEVNNIAVSINGKVWKIFAGAGPDSSQAFFKQKQGIDELCKKKSQTPNKFGKLSKWSWGVTGEAPTA